MAKHRRETFSGQPLPKMLYACDTPEQERAPEPAMEREFMRDERADQHADFFEFLNSFQWFHCRDGCRRRFYYTKMPLPCRRVPCAPGEKINEGEVEAPGGPT